MKFQSCSVSAYSVDFQREHLEEKFLSWVLPVIVSSGDDGISHCPGISMCHLQICEVTTLDSLARINYIPVQLKWKRNWDFLSSSSPFFFFVHRNVTTSKTTCRKSQRNPHQFHCASIQWQYRCFQVFSWAVPYLGASLTVPSKVSFCL